MINQINSKLKFKLNVFIIFLFLPILSNCQTSLKGKVVSIKDGDTIGILEDNKEIKIRLYGIDCPEKHQDFGQKAKQFTSERCAGKEVKINVKGKDYFGRVLGEVILPDGKNLNEELVQAGMAWHFKKYSNSKELNSMEVLARQQKVGLWSHPNPVPPWKFRKDQKNKIKPGKNN